MGKLTERLKDPSRSGVYRATRVDAIEEAVRGTRLNYARISLKGVQGKEQLVQAIAQALGFPEWFGGNWDALEDCLTDLSWRVADGHVFVFEAFEAVLNDDLGILIDVLASSAEFWAARGKPFFAVFIDPDRALGLADLFRET
jgi:RNAse (barnase) inhibitor barstar